MSKAINLAKTSAKGGFNLFWGVAASSIISALGVILVARILSPSEYGLVAIILIAPNLIQIIRDLGVDQATIKYTAQYNQENKPAKIKNILAAGITFELLLGSTLSITSYLLSSFLATNILNRPEITPLIQIASITIFGHALLKTAQSAFTGYERMEYHSTILIVHSTLRTTLMILLVLLGLGTYGAIIGHTIAYLFSGLFSIILLYLVVYKRLHRENHKLEILKTIKNMLKYGLPISGSMILNGFLQQFYSFLIAIYLSDQIVGNYQAAINFAVIVTFFVIPATTTLFPVFSKINPRTEPETLISIFRASVKYASLLVVPATVMLMALSKPAVSTLFGTKYEYTPLYLAIYIIFYLYTAFGHLSAENILKGQGKTQLHLKITLIKSLIGVILSLTLIPIFGIFGFLAAHLTADVPSLIIALWWIKKHYNASINWTSSTKILTASVIAAIITFAIVSVLNLANWINLIIGALIFSSTYLITAPLVGAINYFDVKNLQEILKALGPLAPIFNIPLYVIEKLAALFQKQKAMNR